MQSKPWFVWVMATGLALVVVVGLVFGARARDLTEIWVCVQDPARPFVAAALGGTKMHGVEIVDMPVTAFAGQTTSAPPFLRARVSGGAVQYFLVERPRQDWARYVRSDVWYRSRGEMVDASRRAAENLLQTRRVQWDVDTQPIEMLTGGTR
jgi:hypothetical protein